MEANNNNHDNIVDENDRSMNPAEGGNNEELAVISTSFHEDPTAYLQAVAARPSLRAHIPLLTGPATMNMTAAVAEVYLIAAAKQLLAFAWDEPTTNHAVAASSAAGSNPPTTQAQQAAAYFEVLTTVGVAVTLCPRARILATNILETLAQIQLYEQQLHSADTMMLLTRTQVEFLHACIWADAYEYALEQLQRLTVHQVTSEDPNTASPPSTTTSLATMIWWPLPRTMASQSSSSSKPSAFLQLQVQDVLRYYYLRGSLYLHTHRYKLALRCWETCLSVPTSQSQSSNVVSSIALATWKKLVLAQCLVHVHKFPGTHYRSSQQGSSRSTAAAATTTIHAILPDNARIEESMSSPFLKLPLTASKTLIRFLERFGPKPTTAPRSQATVAPENADLDSVMMREVQDTMDSTSLLMPPSQEVIDVDDPAQFAAAASTTGPFTPTDAYGISPYILLARAFEEVDHAGLMEATRLHQIVFERDGNWSLVQCLQTQYWHRRLVLDIARVYSNLSLSDLAKRLQQSPEQVRELLRELQTEHLWAVEVTTHVASDGQEEIMVHFLPLSSSASLITAQAAAQQEAELAGVAQMVQTLHLAIATSSTYITAARRELGNNDALGPPRGVEEL